MTVRDYTLFDTAIGRCVIAWSERGIAALQLPEASDDKTRARLLRRFPQAREMPPPPDVQAVIDGIVALTGGNAADPAAHALDHIVLDTDGVPPFNWRVYEVARAIAPGHTLTYGDIAARLGEPGAAREVGQALGQNPFAIIVPCHRVVAAGHKAGGFSAHGGAATKLRMLAIEGALPDDQPTLFDRDGGLAFDLGKRRGGSARRRG